MARARSRSRSYSPRPRSRSPPRERKSYDDNRHRERLSSRDRESSDPSGLLIRNLPLDARSFSLSHTLCMILEKLCSEKRLTSRGVWILYEFLSLWLVFKQLDVFVEHCIRICLIKRPITILYWHDFLAVCSFCFQAERS